MNTRKTRMAVTRISGEPVIRLLAGAAVHCLDFFSSGMSYILTFRIIRKCLLGLSLILFIWSAFSKKPKLVAVLYTLALFFSALTITSSEDIYRLYRFRVVHLIVLYSVLFLYMVMAAYGRGKPRIVFFVLSLASLGAVVYIAEGGNILNGFSIVEVPGYLFSTAQLPTLV